ncbi:MAG: hypothetical protein J2P36_22195 [Ktedonobacteraceae bacterium]|nr:hypothetical protein [Ktedonobacteraceae bacterium]
MPQSPYPDPIPVPMEDELLHTEEHRFCSNPTCPCHDDPSLIASVAQQVDDGLLLPDEATRLVQGKQI